MILKSAPPVFSNIQSIENTNTRKIGNVFSMETPEVRIIKMIAKASDKMLISTAGFLSKLTANIDITANMVAGAFPFHADRRFWNHLAKVNPRPKNLAEYPDNWRPVPHRCGNRPHPLPSPY